MRCLCQWPSRDYAVRMAHEFLMIPTLQTSSQALRYSGRHVDLRMTPANALRKTSFFDADIPLRARRASTGPVTSLFVLADSAMKTAVI